MNHTDLPPTRKIASIALFTAVAVATDYAMFPLSNIKLMDTIVFVCGLVFGLDVGLSVASLTWLVYGSVNPLGTDSAGFLILLMASECIYAVLGWMSRTVLGLYDPQAQATAADLPARSLSWGSIGLVGTLLYDLNTIITPAVLLEGSSLPASAIGAYILPAIPFMLAHEISNFIFFATVGPLLVGAIRRVTWRGVGEQRIDVQASRDPSNPPPHTRSEPWSSARREGDSRR